MENDPKSVGEPEQVERLMAENDRLFKAGAEAMREAAAKACDASTIWKERDPGAFAAKLIRAMPVERYRLEPHGKTNKMMDRKDGDLVKYSDYVSQAQRIATLEEENARLRSDIAGLRGMYGSCRAARSILAAEQRTLRNAAVDLAEARDRAVEALRKIEARTSGPSFKMGHDITKIVVASLHQPLDSEAKRESE